MRKLIICPAIIIGNLPLTAQTGSYLEFGQAYVKLLIDRGSNTQQRIGIYKVKGTSFLFGEKLAGGLFEKGAKSDNIFLNYNTYNQQIQFYSSLNQVHPYGKEINLVDSFTIKKDKVVQLTEDIHFVNGRHINALEKGFYQVVVRGARCNLYKKYTSNLAIVATNYAQSDLRQFELEYAYYYTDTANKILKKLSLTCIALKQNFLL